MSAPWVFLEAPLESGIAELDPDEARHVASRRLRVGDPLVVFDGRGRTAAARILERGRRSTAIEIGAIETTPEPEEGTLLATAIPKGERLSTLLQMTSQLGLSVWQPLVLEESVVRTLDVSAPRIARILREGCKVARRPWLLRVLPPRGLAEVLEGLDADVARYYGDREGAAPALGAGRSCLFVGPEAGFSAGERARLEAVGASPVSFGPYNLRIETAAVAAVAAAHGGAGRGVGRPAGERSSPRVEEAS